MGWEWILSFSCRLYYSALRNSGVSYSSTSLDISMSILAKILPIIDLEISVAQWKREEKYSILMQSMLCASFIITIEKNLFSRISRLNKVSSYSKLFSLLTGPDRTVTVYLRETHLAPKLAKSKRIIHVDCVHICFNPKLELCKRRGTIFLKLTKNNIYSFKMWCKKNISR